MKANTYSLMRQCGIVPRESTENPVVTELLIAFEPLLKAALAKGKPPAHEAFRRTVESIPLPEPAIPGMPEPANAAELLRRATPVEQPFAILTPQEKPKIIEIVAKRTKTGRLFGSIITLSNGRTFETTITARDELGRATCVDYGGLFQLRAVRDSEGKIVKMVPAEDYGSAPGKFGKLS